MVTLKGFVDRSNRTSRKTAPSPTLEPSGAMQAGRLRAVVLTLGPEDHLGWGIPESSKYPSSLLINGSSGYSVGGFFAAKAPRTPRRILQGRQELRHGPSHRRGATSTPDSTRQGLRTEGVLGVLGFLANLFHPALASRRLGGPSRPSPIRGFYPRKTRKNIIN